MSNQQNDILIEQSLESLRETLAELEQRVKEFNVIYEQVAKSQSELLVELLWVKRGFKGNINANLDLLDEEEKAGQ